MKMTMKNRTRANPVSHTPPFELRPPLEDGLGVPKKIVHGDCVEDAALCAHERLSLLVHGEDEGDGVLDRKRGLERELRDAGRINVHVHLAEEPHLARETEGAGKPCVQEGVELEERERESGGLEEQLEERLRRASLAVERDREGPHLPLGSRRE